MIVLDKKIMFGVLGIFLIGIVVAPAVILINLDKTIELSSEAKQGWDELGADLKHERFTENGEVLDCLIIDGINFDCAKEGMTAYNEMVEYYGSRGYNSTRLDEPELIGEGDITLTIKK